MAARPVNRGRTGSAAAGVVGAVRDLPLRGRTPGRELPRARLVPPRGPDPRGADERLLGMLRSASAVPAEPREGAGSGVPGGVVELLLDPQQLVVLGDPLRAGRCPG